jgi:uncharacterized protein HemY
LGVGYYLRKVLYYSVSCFWFFGIRRKKRRRKEMVSGLINANPVIYEKKERRVRSAPSVGDDEHAVEPIDQLEVFDNLFINFS